MNIRIATSSLVSLPLIKAIHEQHHLTEILIDENSVRFAEILNGLIPQVPNRLISRDEALKLELPETTDFQVSLGFPFKLKPHGNRTLNIHFGELPENRGPAPLFWTLKAGRKIAYITIHELTESYDSGRILSLKGHSILPGENFGLLNSKLGNLCIPQVLQCLTGNIQAKGQDESQAKFYPMPTEKDSHINWQSMASTTIENLVNACNPIFNGAKTRFNGMNISLLEVVAPEQFQLTNDQLNKKPGSVIQANQNGLAVICADKRPLIINIAAMHEGIFSGSKLIAMGMNEQVSFTDFQH